MNSPVMFRSVACLAAALVVGLTSQALHAQETGSSSQLQQHPFWGSIGFGGGKAALTCHFCSGRRRSSYSGALAFGARLRGRALVGIEIQGWRYSNSETTERVLAATPVIQFYPWSQPVFVKAGLGAASFNSWDDTDRLSHSSVAGTVGAGFDWRFSPRYVLTPYVSALNGVDGSMRLNRDLVTRTSGVLLFQYGVAIAFR
jgi:hypothetical protein